MADGTGSRPSLRIYVAAPFGERLIAQSVAQLLTEVGHRVVSTWHETTAATEADDPEERRSILLANKLELSRAQVLVACTAVGTPRGTYGEIGRFLEKGRPVVWLQGPAGEGANIDDADELVTIVRAPADLVAVVSRLAVRLVP